MTACRIKSQRPLASERGIALAVVLLILVVVLLLGTTLVSVSVTEDRAGSVRGDMKKAFSAAETGIQETMYRMHLDPASYPNEWNTACSATPYPSDPVVIGSVPGGAHTVPNPDPTSANFWKYNPPACSWTYTPGDDSDPRTPGNFFGGKSGNLDSAGRTFTSSGTSHVGVGALLASASPPNDVSYTVTVAPVVGFVGGCWQYVMPFADGAGNPVPLPGSSCASVAPNPMFKVTSTGGTVRNAKKTLSVMIQQYAINPPLTGALTANSYVNVQSASAVIDGHNFDCDGNNPSTTGALKAVTVPSDASISINKPSNLQCAAGTGQGLADCGGISPTFGSTLGMLLLGLTTKPPEGSAARIELDNLDSYLSELAIDPVAHPEMLPTSPFTNGILFVKGDYQKPPDASSGVLIVHNDSYTANLGNFNTGTFKGLIIADKINKINGNAQITGGILAIGPTSTVSLDDLTGTPNVRYSKQCIESAYGTFLFRIVKGTFHEQWPAAL